MINIDLRLAWRNLWRHRRRTWLTLSAMIFSNILLVLFISLQTGSYSMMINNTLSVLSGHIQIQQQNYLDDPSLRHTVNQPQKLASQLRQALTESKVAVRAVGFAIASSAERSIGVQVTGVEPSMEPSVSVIPGLVQQGKFFSADESEEVIVGSVLARNLKLQVGDELTILGSGYDGSMAVAVLKVVGVFHSGISEIDRQMIEIPLAVFQRVFAMEKRAHQVVLQTPDVQNLDQRMEKIESLLDSKDLSIRDWDQLQPGLKQAIQADMSSSAFMYFTLILLVALSVLNTQLMSVLERTREFGTILAIGVKPLRIIRLIFLESALMAALGFAIGLSLGFLLSLYLSLVGFSYPGMEEMASQFNMPAKIYPNISFASLLLGPSIVFAACLLAAVYPAGKIFFLSPIKAMRAV